MEKAPSLFILDRSENYSLVYELETLVYKETQYGINNATIDDGKDKFGHFDLLASLRYAVVSENTGIYFQPVNVTEEDRRKQQEETDQQIREDLKDPEKLKEMEIEADKKIMKEEFYRRRNK